MKLFDAGFISLCRVLNRTAFGKRTFVALTLVGLEGSSFS